MPGQLEAALARWQAAGLITPEGAERIRAFEYSAGAERQQQLRWPVLVALGAGALMVGAGILLFVSAHWDGMSPALQFTLTLLLVAVFHVAAAVLGERFEALTSVLHALGTAALGAGIFLTAQIFNLQSNWPSGVLLWALGAGVAWYLRREWTQAAFVAILLPVWLAGQWSLSAEGLGFDHDAVWIAGLLLLALSYLWAESPSEVTSTRRLLRFLGALAVLPLGVATVIAGSGIHPTTSSLSSDQTALVLGWLLFLGIPLIIGWVFRRQEAWPLLVAALWVWVGARSLWGAIWQPFVWGAVGSLGLVAAGVRDRSVLRVNLGVVGFALTVLLFYFSNVMDKLGRSESLILGGLIFLAGGWALERLRRRLVAGLRSRELVA